ncbi:hypothetical protein JYU34_018526 [Plutella xylostella]|uniref:Uncharacterized protein n=1 Tax=Plutella xylostella TaxID=51655 RepID=A0ABQ7PZ55_PLUXY|nr:hypothetical protein JYU34_018526 [Plutella xylostella]
MGNCKMFSKLKFSAVLVFILVFVLENRCDGKISSRKAKLLTFNTDDDDTLAVNLEFSIPFVKIPIKKTMETFGPTDVSLPSINVNLAGLAIGGAVVAATVVGIPLFMKTFAALHPEQRYSRGKTTSVTLITFIALD